MYHFSALKLLPNRRCGRQSVGDDVDGDMMPTGYRSTGRDLAMQACLVAAAALAFTATAETSSPQDFVERLYRPYLDKNANGNALTSDAMIRGYFAPPLADAIIKDFAVAEKRGEVPLLNGDPFVDAQDWEISNLNIAVKPTGADTAMATVTFVMFMEPRTVTLDLLKSPAGWRITEIRSASGSLRALYKLN
jgi:hypothetical protein